MKIIPERHRAEYDNYCEEGSWEQLVVEELGAAEAALSEAQQAAELAETQQDRDEWKARYEGLRAMDNPRGWPGIEDSHDRHSVALMQQRKEQAATISQYEAALDDIIHARDFGEALNVARRVMGSCPKEGHPKEQS